MNCSPTIAIALLLLSLTAGVWLLYKTQKENLGTFFKVVAWFVIVISIGSMVCCGMRCIFKCCKAKSECSKTEQCGMQGEERGHGMCKTGHKGMSERIIVIKGDEDECEMMSKGCCKDKMECKDEKEECEGEKMSGEKKCDMKMGMKKDSVVKKK